MRLMRAALYVRTSTFDQTFLDGLSRFQIRNGLRVSGFVDQRTLAALNVTAQERLGAVEAARFVQP